MFFQVHRRHEQQHRSTTDTPKGSLLLPNGYTYSTGNITSFPYTFHDHLSRHHRASPSSHKHANGPLCELESDEVLGRKEVSDIFAPLCVYSLQAALYESVNDWPWIHPIYTHPYNCITCSNFLCSLFPSSTSTRVQQNAEHHSINTCGRKVGESQSFLSLSLDRHYDSISRHSFHDDPHQKW